MSQNVGRHIEGLGYAEGIPIEDEMAIYDGLPKAVREVIAQMPARGNVRKYARLVRFQGEAAAIEAARIACYKFYALAELEKRTGEYFKP